MKTGKKQKAKSIVDEP